MREESEPKSSLFLEPSPSSVAVLPVPGQMLEEYSRAVTAYLEGLDSVAVPSAALAPAPPSLAPEPLSVAAAPSSPPAHSSMVAVPAPAPAPGRMLEEYSGVVSVTIYTEAFNGSGDKPPSSAQLTSSLPPPAPALGRMPRESSGAVSVTAYPEENNLSSSALLSSSMPASAPALGRMLEESSAVIAVTAYPKASHASRNNPSSPAPLPTSVPAPVLASGRMLEESNGAVSVTPYPEAQPFGWMLEDRGPASATVYPQAGHSTGKKKWSPPSSVAALEPASGRTLEDCAKEWAARKAAVGAPLHHCVLPFLTGAPKAVECRVCYKIIHPLEEIKCSVSRCEQSFHLTCAVEYTANFTAESFKCPQHACMVCKQKMFFWRCGRCTVAAHTKCAPWPVIHLKDDQGSSICWRHPVDWLLQNEEYFV